MAARRQAALERRFWCAGRSCAPDAAACGARAARAAAERHRAVAAARECVDERIERRWEAMVDEAERLAKLPPTMPGAKP